MSSFWMDTVGRESLIAADDTWGLLAIMAIGVFFAIWLEQKYKWASRVSGCIIALITAMVLANLGIIPTSCVLYDDVVWGIIVPLGIPMLLLNCDLKKIWAETGRMLVIFLFGAAGTVAGGETQAAAFWSRKDISLKDIAANIAYSASVVWVSRLIAELFCGLEQNGLLMNFIVKFLGSQYVWITTISVLVATFMADTAKKMHGSQEIGTFCIYMFLFVIGVPANFYTVIVKSPLLLVLTVIIVSMNMIFSFGAAKLFGYDLEDAIIASNANIGGPTTAAGMAVSQGWTELVGPSILIGTLGYVIGNYLGTVVAVSLGL